MTITKTKAMGNAITYEARMVWLGMRRQGGWWTLSLLRQQWAGALAEFELQDAVDALVAGRFLERRDNATHSPSYCHTSSCLTLPGHELIAQVES